MKNGELRRKNTSASFFDDSTFPFHFLSKDRQFLYTFAFKFTFPCFLFFGSSRLKIWTCIILLVLLSFSLIKKLIFYPNSVSTNSFTPLFTFGLFFFSIR